MASFFENLGRKITSAGQGVAQQTKTFAEVTKLNGVISDREKKMNALFMEIGRVYYAQHRDDMACDQQQKVAQIRDMEAEIAQLQEQIKQIRGYTKCTVCGNDIPNGAKFCNACGSMVEEQPVYNQAPMKVCPNCGAQIADDCLFCTSCGYRMVQPEAQQPVQPQPEVPQYAQPQPEVPQYAQPQPEMPQYAQPQPFVQAPQQDIPQFQPAQPQDIPQFQPAQPQDLPQFRPAQPQQDPNVYDPNHMM